MANKLSIFMTTSLAVLAGLTSCNEDKNTKDNLQTLDNFASGITTSNYECKGTHKVVSDLADASRYQVVLSAADKSREESYRQAIQQYLTAIPEDLQQMFADLQGRFLVIDNAGKDGATFRNFCTFPFETSGSSQYIPNSGVDIKGCYNHSHVAGTQKSLFAVVHQPDTSAIIKGGVRIFGYLHSQFYPRLNFAEKRSAPEPYSLAATENTELRGFKKNLSTAFVKDIYNGRKYDFAKLEPVLGIGSKETLTAQFASGSVDPLAALTFRFAGETAAPSAEVTKARRERFEDFVMAEAFDSYHCSAETIKVMEADFPTSTAAYKEIDALILAAAKQFVNSRRSGFSLTGPNLVNLGFLTSLLPILTIGSSLLSTASLFRSATATTATAATATTATSTGILGATNPLASAGLLSFFGSALQGFFMRTAAINPTPTTVVPYTPTVVVGGPVGTVPAGFVGSVGLPVQTPYLPVATPYPVLPTVVP